MKQQIENLIKAAKEIRPFAICSDIERHYNIDALRLANSKLGKALEEAEKIDWAEGLQVAPILFYVVSSNTEDKWEQITNALENFEKAREYRDGSFCKKKYPHAFIVASVNETHLMNFNSKEH